MTEGANRITSARFLARPLDPLTFYDILPSDGFVLEDPPQGSPHDTLALLAASNPADLSESLVDRARLLLLGCRRTFAGTESHLLERVALNATRWYAGLLQSGKSRRSLRMKLQQLNYFLRDCLDAEVKTAGVIATKQADAGTPPWDFIKLAEGELRIVSGPTDNVHWTWGTTRGAASCGFPSQLDLIDGRRVSIGSIFSPGAWIFANGRVAPVAHHAPVVLVLNHDGGDWILDYEGSLFDARGRCATRLPSPLRQVDRARRIGSRLIISDWTRPETIAFIDLDSMRSEVASLPGILLLNDICFLHGRYYALCKQQGRVFSFADDGSFAPRGSRLAFGRGFGRLFDPIALRPGPRNIEILNWVTRTRVVADAF
jgi:hypothetical protein